MNAGRSPSKPVFFMTSRISASIRATSRFPVSWTCSGVTSSVVKLFTSAA